MEFLAAGYQIIEQEPGLEGIYKAIELPGRTCYGSQDRIAPGSAEKFVKGLMKSNHGAPLEHGTVYLTYKYPRKAWNEPQLIKDYQNNPYSVVRWAPDDDDDYIACITTNLRVLFENGWLDHLDKYLCEPTRWHERRYQVKFTVDRFTGEEFLRHRKGSFNRESTRYVLFTREKFGSGSIKYIVPTWVLDKKSKLDHYAENSLDWYVSTMYEYTRTKQPLDDLFVWTAALKFSEWSYSYLTTECGWTAQQARTVLPCAINSPLIMTAFIDDWKHFFDLRAIGTTGAPHPQAKELAEPLMNEFIERGYLTYDKEVSNI
jgi:thymidylate synthase (FAD)